MKIQSINLKYFKKFKNQPLDFTDPETGLARDIIVLIGMNGAGKTSILQAIAATLGVATGRLQKLFDLKWAGFNYELLGSNWGKFEPEVTLQVQFSSQEIQAVREFQQKLQDKGSNLRVSRAGKPIVDLRWQGESVQANTANELFQFKGREYAKRLLRSEGFEVFERVGMIFWHTEQRNSTSLTTENPDGKKVEITYDTLRDRLSKWRQFHQDVERKRIQLRPGQKDIYAEIEQAYKAVFPERGFEGPVPREGIDDILSEPWFYLYYDKSNLYEISEMSGGERAIFPMLVDFVNWNIHNSVILIDEIELHLHPPLQQALLRALPKLGKNNQFIITTHSDYIEQLVPEAHIVRVEV
jgi:predicted ATP-dependent endonuclease of OLD family